MSSKQYNRQLIVNGKLATDRTDYQQGLTRINLARCKPDNIEYQIRAELIQQEYQR